MARERNMPDLKRKGNWKNAPDDTPKKKKTKKAPVGQGAKPKAKPDMQIKKAAAKVKSPAKNSGASRSTSGKVKKAAQNRSGDAVLGQDRKSPAASKMNRQPGYSSSNSSAKADKKSPTSVRGKGSGKADKRKSGAQTRYKR